MRTGFTIAQLTDPDTAHAEQILRACVHCGFCNATCPTYIERNDELDSPRGRIYLIREMLEKGGTPADTTVTHIDRCLSCLGCMTTCPSGVDYMHLVDHARSYVKRNYARPVRERLLRSIAAALLPRRHLFRFAISLGRLARPIAPILPPFARRMIALAGTGPIPAPASEAGRFSANEQYKLRVALLTGCVQPSLAPEINRATIRLLNRHGVEVVIPPGAGCCGALTHHMGADEQARKYAAKNIASWMKKVRDGGLDHLVITTSGCGVHVRDYGHLFRHDRELAADAEHISRIAVDITQLMAQIGIAGATNLPDLRIACHTPCSMQHGPFRPHGGGTLAAELLRGVGFDVRIPQDAHLCCGAAGTYTLFQPELSDRLRTRKLDRIQATEPDVIATGNVGCQMHIAEGSSIPVVHTVQLLDWATGGPCPPELMSKP